MSHYRVSWEIDIDAESPREAAEKAREIQQDVFSTATVFVCWNGDTGEDITIDTEEDES